ncbi:MAG: hypothetical protein ACLQU3_02475 [Limisphaerales bacterium]
MNTIPLFRKPSFARNYEAGTSAFMVDLRKSSALIRDLSYTATFQSEILKIMGMKRDIYNKIRKHFSADNSFTFNDTGDGLLFIMWNAKHAWSALFGALTAYGVLKNLIIGKERLGFGIGLHCGGCLVYRVKQSGLFRDFAYGIVANTAARVESYTKQMVNTPLLMTGHFNNVLEEQDPSTYLKIKDNIHRISDTRFLLNDSKAKGHVLYTIKDLDEHGIAGGMLNVIPPGT